MKLSRKPDNSDAVIGAEGLDKFFRRIKQDLSFIFSAAAEIQQQDQRNRSGYRLKKRDILLNTVFEDNKILFFQIHDWTIGKVRDFDIEIHEIGFQMNRRGIIIFRLLSLRFILRFGFGLRNRWWIEGKN